MTGCSNERVADSAEPSVREAERKPVGKDPDEVPTDAESFPTAGTVRVVFLGDSITAGYGVGEEEAFPALIQDKLDEADVPVSVVEAGVSGGTSAEGLRRIDWVLQNPIDVLVLELGGNDGLRGLDLSATEENLRGIIRKTLDRYPDCRIVIAGMQVPTNIGHEYTALFREIYPKLAAEFDADLIPFILEGVGGVEKLMQPDAIHPTAEGHRRVAETVWQTLEPIVIELLEARSN